MGLSREHVRSKVIADTLNDVRTTFTYLVQGSGEGKNGTNLRERVFKQISDESDKVDERGPRRPQHNQRCEPS